MEHLVSWESEKKSLGAYSLQTELMKFISLVLYVYRNISYLKFLQGADFSPLFVSLRQPNSAVQYLGSPCWLQA